MYIGSLIDRMITARLNQSDQQFIVNEN